MKRTVFLSLFAAILLAAMPARAESPTEPVKIYYDRTSNVLGIHVKWKLEVSRIEILLPPGTLPGLQIVRWAPGWRSQSLEKMLILSGPPASTPAWLSLHFLRFDPRYGLAVRALLQESELFADTFPVAELSETELTPKYLAESIVLPPRVEPGEVVRFSITSEKLKELGGSWYIAERKAEPTLTGLLEVTLPEELSAGADLHVTFEAPWGEEFPSEPVRSRIRVVPTAQPSSSFKLCSPGTRVLGPACFCGLSLFTDPWQELSVDGLQIWQPLALSPRSVCLALSPGAHTVAVPDSAVQVEALEVHAEYPQPLPSLGTFPITWKVTGTRDPVKLLLVNRTPDLFHLEGGDSQVVTTAGGEVNSVMRTGRTTNTTKKGSLNVEVTLADESSIDKPRAPVQATTTTTRLDELEPLFRRALKEISAGLSGTAASSKVEALDILKLRQKELHESLPAPELAAFRDYADALFEQARNEIEQRDRAAGFPAGRAGRPLFAALRPPAPPSERKSAPQSELSFREVLGKLAATLKKLAEGRITRRLRIRSTPDGATVSMHPKSYPAFELPPFRTDSSNCHVPLGRYDYKVVKNGFQEIASFVDVISEEQEVLDCKLQPAGTQKVPPCAPQTGKVEDCP